MSYDNRTKSNLNEENMKAGGAINMAHVQDVNVLLPQFLCGSSTPQKCCTRPFCGCPLYLLKAERAALLLTWPIFFSFNITTTTKKRSGDQRSSLTQVVIDKTYFGSTRRSFRFMLEIDGNMGKDDRVLFTDFSKCKARSGSSKQKMK